MSKTMTTIMTTRRRYGGLRGSEEGEDRCARSTTDPDIGSEQGPRGDTLPNCGRVTRIDVTATKEEIRTTLAKESGCKAEDVRLGEIRLARNGLDRCGCEARPVQ